jgi:hypothetical protein
MCHPHYPNMFNICVNRSSTAYIAASNIYMGDGFSPFPIERDIK